MYEYKSVVVRADLGLEHQVWKWKLNIKFRFVVVARCGARFSTWFDDDRRRSLCRKCLGDEIDYKWTYALAFFRTEMGLFKEFRERGWNTYYPGRPTPPQLDVTTAVVAYLAVVLAAAVIMIVVGTRGHQVQV